LKRTGKPKAGRRTRNRNLDLPRVYQLKVTLMETDPPIWRRLRVPGNTTLPRLDRIIQTAMGWTNSHLHTFTTGGVIYAVPDPEWGIDVKDERRVRLDRIAKLRPLPLSAHLVWNVRKQAGVSRVVTRAP
jgi:hypothetical protein